MVFKEKRLFRQGVKSLKDKLVLTEPFPVLYYGASAAFLKYSRILEKSYAIPEIERLGSIAGLAKRELQMQFAQENLPQWQRYSLGRALGFSPEQIHVMHNNIGEYFKFVTQEVPSIQKSFEDEVRIREEDLNYEKSCREFEKMFPGEKANYFFAVKLEQNSNTHGYDIRVLSQPCKKFLLRDPVSEKDLDLLFDHLRGLPGEISKKMMLEYAA